MVIFTTSAVKKCDISNMNFYNMGSSYLCFMIFYLKMCFHSKQVPIFRFSLFLVADILKMASGRPCIP